MRSETRAVPVELLREWKAFVAHHHTINASPGGDAAQDRIASEMQALLDAEPAEPSAEELLEWYFITNNTDVCPRPHINLETRLDGSTYWRWMLTVGMTCSARGEVEGDTPKAALLAAFRAAKESEAGG